MFKNCSDNDGRNGDAVQSHTLLTLFALSMDIVAFLCLIEVDFLSVNAFSACLTVHNKDGKWEDLIW